MLNDFEFDEQKNKIKELESFCVGMLSDYLGRQYVGMNLDLIETFYPNEITVASIFRTKLVELRKLLGIETQLKIEVGEEGHWDFKHHDLRLYLDSYYRFISEKGTRISKGFGDTKQYLKFTGELLIDEFYTEEMRRAFLRGAFLRASSDSLEHNAIYFANSISKIDIVAIFLKDIGATNVQVNYNVYPGSIPTCKCVTFDTLPENDWKSVGL